MPRTSSNSSSSRTSYSKPSYSKPSYSSNSKPSYSPAYIPTNTPSYKPPTVVEHKVEQPGFFSNVMQGFAWGTGTSIARNIFESKPVPVIQQVPIVNHSIKNEECREYKLCKQLSDPYECFSKIDQKEYELCKEKN